MSSPKRSICGAHRLDVSAQLFSNAMEWKYRGQSLSTSERDAAEKHVRAELDRVVLLEVCIQNCDEHFNVDDFSQTGSDQAAYDEVFLTEDGVAIAAKPVAPFTGQTLRVAFYFHFLDPNKPLNTSYGPVEIPTIEPMPPRLNLLVPYDPVD